MSISITGPIAGFITAEILRKVANKMDNKDEEVQEHLEKNDIESAIETVAEDQTTLEKFFNNLTDVMENDDEFDQDDISKVQSYKNQQLRERF